MGGPRLPGAVPPAGPGDTHLYRTRACTLGPRGCSVDEGGGRTSAAGVPLCRRPPCRAEHPRLSHEVPQLSTLTSHFALTQPVRVTVTLGAPGYFNMSGPGDSTDDSRCDSARLRFLSPRHSGIQHPWVGLLGLRPVACVSRTEPSGGHRGPPAPRGCAREPPTWPTVVSGWSPGEADLRPLFN